MFLLIQLVYKDNVMQKSKKWCIEIMNLLLAFVDNFPASQDQKSRITQIGRVQFTIQFIQDYHAGRAGAHQILPVLIP